MPKEKDNNGLPAPPSPYIKSKMAGRQKRRRQNRVKKKREKRQRVSTKFIGGLLVPNSEMLSVDNFTNLFKTTN